MPQTQLTVQDIEKLNDVLRIVKNIEADLNNAVNNTGLIKLSTMSNGDFLTNLGHAIDEVNRLTHTVLKQA
jgi:nitrous oxide reductase